MSCNYHVSMRTASLFLAPSVLFLATEKKSDNIRSYICTIYIQYVSGCENLYLSKGREGHVIFVS